MTMAIDNKKMDQGKIKFILLKKAGKAIIDTSVTDEEILAGIKELIFDETE